MATKPKLLSIDEIMTGVAAASEEIKQTNQKTQEIRAEQAAATGRQREIISQAGDDAAAIARQTGIAALKVQQENIRAAQAAGIEETSNALLDMLASQKEANARLVARTGKIRELRGATPGEVGVLSWIGRNFQAAFQEKAMEGEVQEVQAISTAIVNTNNALQETFTTNKGKAEVTTAATILAQERIAAADAKIKAEQATIEGLGFNLAGVEAAQKATIEQLNLRYSGMQAVNAVKADQRADADQAMQKERFSWEKEMHTVRMSMLKAEKEDKSLDDKLSQDFVTTVNMGRATLRQAPLDEVEQRSVLKAFKSGQPRIDLELMYQLGVKSRQNGGQQVFGNSAAAAAELVFSPELDIQVAASQEATKGILAEAAKAIPIQIKNSKDKAQISQALNKNVNEFVAQQFGTKEGVDGRGYIGLDSPFSVGDIGSADSGYFAAPTLASNPLVVKVLKPLAATGVQLKDPRTVVETVKAAMRKGEITSSQAAEGLSRVYQVANDMNQAQRNFAGYGIALPNKGAQYIVKIGSDKWDLTKPEQVQRLLMKPSPSPFSRVDSPFVFN